mgnify:CR=1 FL=1
MARVCDTLIIHCSATKPSQDIGAAEIRKWHLDRGFADIGYHYVIRRDGKVERGRKEERAGAHCEGWNARSLGVCLVGGVNDKGQPEDNFTPEQWSALDGLVRDILKRHPTIKRVIGHRDTGARKACPSFDVRTKFTELGIPLGNQ